MINNLFKNCLLVNSIFYLAEKEGSRLGGWEARRMDRSAEGPHSLRSILLVAGFEDRYAQGF